MSYPIAYKWGVTFPNQGKTSFREAVCHLQRTMLEVNGGDALQDACPVTHHFAPKVYGRECLLPAGVTVVGKLHKHAHLNIVIRGRAKVVTEFGASEVKAGDVFISQPGTKRAVHAIEETVWVTVHPNDSDTRDLSEIENYVIAPSYESLGLKQKEVLS